MNRIAAMLIVSGLLAGGTLFAQQNRGGRGGRGERGERPRMSSEENTKKWADVQAQLKKKYPEKFAEIEKLAATNIPAAMQKMYELAREAKIALPIGGQRGRFGGGREGFGGRDGQRPEGFGGGRGGFGGRDGQRPGRFQGGQQRAEAEAKIKEKFPAEYAEIEKMRNKAEEQLVALAKKADVKLPMPPEAMQRKMAEIREKYKTEFEEIDKLWRTDPQTARERTAEIFKREGIEMPMMRGGQRPSGGDREPPQARRGNPMQRLAEIRKAYPEEMKKLDAIRREDPAKYREELKKLSERYDREHKK